MELKMTNDINKQNPKRRTDTQITLEILEYLYTAKKAKKTWLLNTSHLNSKNFENYFKNLLDKKLIESEGNFFKLTILGIQYMKELQKIRSFPYIMTERPWVGTWDIIRHEPPKDILDYLNHINTVR